MIEVHFQVDFFFFCSISLSMPASCAELLSVQSAILHLEPTKSSLHEQPLQSSISISLSLTPFFHLDSL